jgi:hypothetical protein
LTVVGSGIVHGQGNLTSSGFVEATPHVFRLSTVQLTGSGILSATSGGFVNGQVSMIASGYLEAQAQMAYRAAAFLIGTSMLTGAARVILSVYLVHKIFDYWVQSRSTYAILESVNFIVDTNADYF